MFVITRRTTKLADGAGGHDGRAFTTGGHVRLPQRDGQRPAHGRQALLGELRAAVTAEIVVCSEHGRAIRTCEGVLMAALSYRAPDNASIQRSQRRWRLAIASLDLRRQVVAADDLRVAGHDPAVVEREPAVGERAQRLDDQRQLARAAAAADLLEERERLAVAPRGCRDTCRDATSLATAGRSSAPRNGNVQYVTIGPSSSRR